MMFTTMKPGIFKATGMYVGWLLTASISVDLELYRMDGGIYPGVPLAACPPVPRDPLAVEPPVPPRRDTA